MAAKPPADNRVRLAVEQGKSAEELRALIEEIEQEKGPDAAAAAIEHCGRNERKALEVAHEADRGDLVQVLLEKHPKAVESIYGGGVSLLGMCVVHDLQDLARQLLLAGEDPNGKCNYSPRGRGFHFYSPSFCTPLYICLVPALTLQRYNSNRTPLSPRFDMLKILVDAGANVNGTADGARKTTPLSWVFPHMHSHQEEAVELLLSLGARPNGYAEPLYDEEGNMIDEEDEADDFSGPSPTYPLVDWLKHCTHGQSSSSVLVSCVRKLVAAGAKTSGIADPNPEDCRPDGDELSVEEYEVPLLGIAAKHGHVDVVRYLLEEVGVPADDPEVSGPQALQCSYQRDRYDDTLAARRAIRKLLFAAGADVNNTDAYGETALFACAYEGRPEDLQELLDNGASPNVISGGGVTPLMIACTTVKGDVDEDADERYDDWSRVEAREACARILLPLSSRETRRSVCIIDGESALDSIVRGWELQICYKRYEDSLHKDIDFENADVAAELVVDGVPATAKSRYHLRAVTASHAVPLAAKRLGELDRLLQRPRVTSPLGHEAMVKLAFDFRDAREADEALAATRARLRQLKAELRERGEEVSDHEGDDDDEEEEEDDDEEGGCDENMSEDEGGNTTSEGGGGNDGNGGRA